jgi:hypothetical protein
VTDQLTENEKYIGELLYRYLTIFQFNCHAILEGVPDMEDDFISGYVHNFNVPNVSVPYALI